MCQTIDLYDYFDIRNNTPVLIYFKIRNSEGVKISMRLEERVKNVKKALKSHYKSYTGPVFEIEDLGGFETDVDGMITMSQIINTDKNVDNPCRNYPYDQFDSFAECDHFYVHDQAFKLTGLVPFWAAKTLNETTKEKRLV